MSIKLMSRVWELELPRNQRIVLLAMTDIADDDGTHCYPSVDYLGWKTDYSESQVRRILNSLRDEKLIVPVAFEQGGRGHPTHYHIHLENGVPKPPFVRSWERSSDEGDLEGDTGESNPKGVSMTPFGEENPGPGDTLSPEENPSNMTPFEETPEENPSTAAHETLASETETLAPVRENPSIAMTPDPSLSTTEPSCDPPEGPDVLSATSGSDNESEDFEVPDYWLPMMELEGYARRKYTKFWQRFEKTCAANDVTPEQVIADFADYYSRFRFNHGWESPAAALNRTLAIQISKTKKAVRPQPGRDAHQRRIAAEKDLPAPQFRRSN